MDIPDPLFSDDLEHFDFDFDLDIPAEYASNFSHPPAPNLSLPSFNPVSFQDYASLLNPSDPNSRSLHHRPFPATSLRPNTAVSLPSQSHTLPGSPSANFRLPPQSLGLRAPSPSSASSSSFDDSLFLGSADYQELLARGDTQSTGYIDLTQDSPPPEMPRTIQTCRLHDLPPSARRNTRSVRGLEPIGPTTEPSSSQDRPSKRRKIEQVKGASPELKNEIEEVDLLEVDDDNKLSKALQEEAIRSQQAAADTPVKLSDLSCVICLEKLTNMTITKCGHLFCHTCLMEALIAAERAPAPPGKSRGRCPICRTGISRPKGGRSTRSAGDVIPLEIKVMSRKQWAKGKATAIMRK